MIGYEELDRARVDARALGSETGLNQPQADVEGAVDAATMAIKRIGIDPDAFARFVHEETDAMVGVLIGLVIAADTEEEMLLALRTSLAGVFADGFMMGERVRHAERD